MSVSFTSLLIVNPILKLLQKVQLTALKMPHILDAVFHHYQAVDAAAKGKTGVFVRIDVSSLQHIRMNHTAAQEFDPAFARTNFTIRIFAFTEWAAQRKFKARFSKREIKWIDSHVKLLAVIFL